MLAFAATEPPVLRQSPRVGFIRSRLRLAGYAGGFVLASLLGVGYGTKFGVNSLFGEAYASDLDNEVKGLKNVGFDDGQFSGDEDWFVRLPADSMTSDKHDVPNFYEFDDQRTHRGAGRSLKLYLRSYGGSVSRTIEGPFPRGTRIH
jgi:hypothetical protein